MWCISRIVSKADFIPDFCGSNSVDLLDYVALGGNYIDFSDYVALGGNYAGFQYYVTLGDNYASNIGVTKIEANPSKNSLLYAQTINLRPTHLITSPHFCVTP